MARCSLAEPVNAARPNVHLVLVQSDVEPLGSKRNHVELEIEILAQTVRAAEEGCGVGVCAGDVARGRVHGLGEVDSGDEGERRLSLDTSAEVNEPTEHFASELDSKVNAVKRLGQHTLPQAWF